MKKTQYALIFALVFSSGVSYAQSNMQTNGMAGMDHSNMAQGNQGDHTPQLDTKGYTNGQVKKVNAEMGELTIRHGEIKNLDMPPMTMVFIAKNKSMIQGIKSGDKVKFLATSNGGKLYLTNIINEGAE
jgi:Cu(I)/Ag(I) efflux system periplasmic protein CusF|uniref:copper-binding protein n=1 Tax=Polynucleobacter sp. TaxID=2029855 RepID=UPI004047F035